MRWRRFVGSGTYKISLLAALLPLGLGACAPATVGAAGGAAAGALAGSQVGSGAGQIAATGAGALLGGFLGAEIGERVEEADRERAATAFDEAVEAPVGETTYWRNPETGNRGSVTPVGEGRTEEGRICREYKTTIYIEGSYQEGTGVACRQSNGSWELVR